MSDNLEADIDRSLSHEERAVVAFERIADALTAYANIEAERFKRQYPERREPREATVTHIPTEEDKLRANLHGPEKTLKEWLQPGSFERKFEHSESARKKKESGSPAAPQGKSESD